jgi:phospholipase/carboxylesterase
MNRLFPAPPPTKSNPTTTTARPRQAACQTLPQPAQPYSLFAPLHYEAGYAYPLLVWLHSAGGDERQISRVMPLISLRNYVGLCVRGPALAEQRGYAWPQTADGIAAAEARVLDAIARARDKFNVHHSRIFLAGYESGGTMAVRLALRNPHRFAGAITVGGPLPQDHSPLARLTHLHKFPLLISHCRDSETYPIDHVCQELSLLHSADLAVTLREYPCGDELTTIMLQDLDRWVMQHVTGVPSEEPHEVPLPSDWN